MDIAIWNFITAFGDIRFWLLVILALAVWSFVNRGKLTEREKRVLIIVFVVLIITALATEAIKLAVNAPRICTPCPGTSCNPYCPTDDPHGFPSGHAALSFAMFTAGWLAFTRSRKERKTWSWIFIVPVLIGVSRLALGVHTFEQVVAGAVVGLTVAWLVWLALKPRSRK